MANPWAHSRTENEFDTESTRTVPLNAYEVPAGNSGESKGDGWLDLPGGGYAPALRIAPDGFPDATRLNNGQWVETHPVDGETETREFWHERDAEKAYRESVVEIDTTGFRETKKGFGLADPDMGADRFGRNPREKPPAETRPTESMSPHTWRFWRPFQGNTPHNLNGLHFSMADHRRNYQIYGMTPSRHPGAGTRNTYRIPPTPWDTHVVDMPPQSEAPQATYTDVIVPNTSRSYRL
jgi:hypothetical protein